MRIGLNLVFLGEGAGGVGRYAEELLRGLADRPDAEVHAYVSRDFPARLREDEWAAGVRWHVLPVGLAGPPTHVLAQFCALPVLARRHRLDVLHSPANAGPVRVPGVASVITMHDLIWLHEGEDWGPPSAIRAMRRTSVPTVRRADRVLADSEHARADLGEHLGLDPTRIDVAPLGVRPPDPRRGVTDAREINARFGLGEGPVVLCVAQKRRYKHQAALVRAISTMADPSVRLVLPGAPTPYEDEVRRLAEALGCGDRVRFPSWVSEEDLEGLYARATVFALPSRREGFGLPVLEAMARRVPVACSDRASLPEVVGDAALLFDPDDQGAVDAAIVRLLEDADLRKRLVDMGTRRAASFTWARTAEKTMAAYQRAIAR